MDDFIYEERGYILNLKPNNLNITNVSNNTMVNMNNRTNVLIVSLSIIIFIYISSVYTLLIQKPPNAIERNTEIRRTPHMDRMINNVDENQIVFQYNQEEDNNINTILRELDRNHNTNMIDLINDRIEEFFENTRNTNEINSIIFGTDGKYGKYGKDITDICKDYILQENEECIICKEDIAKNDKMKQLKCEHYFCEECIKKWLTCNNTCPNCRLSIY